MWLVDKLKKVTFGEGNEISLMDYRLWLLFVVINCGANMGFNYYFEQQKVKILLFLLCVAIIIRSSKHILNNRQVLYIASFCFLLFFQSLYLRFYSLSSSIHYMMMISIAVMTVVICGKHFIRLFSSIIFIAATVSLVCYFLSNVLGITIPYIPITSTNIDGGKIMRVFSFYYTQLGNPLEGDSSVRNCGPFWEPGAFQGFLNLALWFELTMDTVRDKWWKLRVLVLITTIFTTLSTGGYVVLFVILSYFFSQDKKISTANKVLLTLGFICIAVYLYTTLDFMSEKIANDEGRLSFSFTDFPNVFYMLFGYGYASESFSQSSMSSASSIFNLFRYMGITGVMIYLSNLLFNKTPVPLVFICVISLILTNEPFLSNAMIWWGIVFVKYKGYYQTKQIRQ